MARKLHKLTAIAVRNAKPGMHSDGGGLYLQVTNSGAKSWLYRFASRGRERWAGLGSLTTISLAEARQEAQKCRVMRLQGVDPIEARKSERAARALATSQGTTFKEAAQILIGSKEHGWRNEKHRRQWRRTLEVYAYPILGALPVNGITTDHILRVLEPIWHRKPETAARVRGRIETVLDAAKARGLRDGENPARWRGHLDHLLPARGKVRRVRHHKALPYSEMPSFMAKLRERGGQTSDALEFLILTAARTGEVAGMRVHEIDFVKAQWSVPAERMKSGKPHIVPLSARALAILRQHTGDDPKALVFPGQSGRPLSDMTLAMVHRRMGFDVTTHGFRSTFRDWAGDCTSLPREVAEAALAHVSGDATERAYRRGDALQKRRELMEDWASYCEPKARKVAPFNLKNAAI